MLYGDLEINTSLIQDPFATKLFSVYVQQARI